MPDTLQVSVGQATDKGVKPLNQDFHAVQIPASPLLESKGIAMALADGISSSSVSQIASATAVQNFLSDYYCTSEAWSVKTSGLKVLAAANSWLYAQTRQSQYRHDMNRGYVCTFSAIVIKSRTLHLFHAGDTRVYQVQGDALEPLTKDHRFYTEENKSYREVVIAFIVSGFIENHLSSLIQIPGVFFQCLSDEVIVNELVDAVGGEHKGVAGIQ